MLRFAMGGGFFSPTSFTFHMSSFVWLSWFFKAHAKKWLSEEHLDKGNGENLTNLGGTT